jgi:hypothetical protein
MTTAAQAEHGRAERLGARLLFFVLLGALFPCVAPAQGVEEVEAKVKAAFLLNFARYVEWPESSFATSNSPVVIGVLGQDTLGRNLDATVDGRTVERRPVKVKRARKVSELRDCQVIFVCPSERERFRGLLAAIQNQPILTVSDTEGFTSAGGMILLKKKQGMMRFEINRDAAEKAGLKISSKLLKLADNYQ